MSSPERSPRAARRRHLVRRVRRRQAPSVNADHPDTLAGRSPTRGGRARPTRRAGRRRRRTRRPTRSCTGTSRSRPSGSAADSTSCSATRRGSGSSSRRRSSSPPASPEIARRAEQGRPGPADQERSPTAAMPRCSRVRGCEARRRKARATSSASSGRYPLCGRGDVNTYAVFAELMRSSIGPTGRVGVIVPTGIATDDTTTSFFQDLVDQRSLVSLFDFKNVGDCSRRWTRRDVLLPAHDGGPGGAAERLVRRSSFNKSRMLTTGAPVHAHRRRTSRC